VLVTNLRQTLGRGEELKEFEEFKEFKEFELQGSLVRRFFTVATGHAPTEHP
jgi:hypothetical protein